MDDACVYVGVLPRQGHQLVYACRSVPLRPRSVLFGLNYTPYPCPCLRNRVWATTHQGKDVKQAAAEQRANHLVQRVTGPNAACRRRQQWYSTLASSCKAFVFHCGYALSCEGAGQHVRARSGGKQGGGTHPQQTAIPNFWWTCSAISSSTRVICPAAGEGEGGTDGATTPGERIKSGWQGPGDARQARLHVQKCPKLVDTVQLVYTSVHVH